MMQFLFLAIGQFRVGVDIWPHVGGGFGLVTAFSGFYLGLASLLGPPGQSAFALPVFFLPGNEMGEQMKIQKARAKNA